MYKKLVLIILSFFLIFLLLFPGCQPATTPDLTGGTISGQAALPGSSSKDITGYTPIPGATVTITDAEGNTHTTLTDSNGFYSFGNITVNANTIIYISKDIEGGGKIVFMEVIPQALSPEENFYAGIADAKSTALALVIEALINLGQPQEEIDLEEIISAPGFALLEEAVRQAQESNQNILTLSSIITQAQAIADYIVNPPSPTPAPTPVPTPTQIDIAAIPGVTVPETGATPVTTITETAQYTGTVTWTPTDNPFQGSTVYTATITLTPKAGFTLTGVAANFFTVTGAAIVTNTTDSGVVTAIFPETAAAVINIAAIPGVTVPVAGATPVTAITATAQYTGTVTWSPNDSTFAGETVYTATITLTAKPGFTLTGVAENFFTVAGATATNPINSGVVTVVFPETAAAVIDIAAIPGVTVPEAGATPVTAITATAQYTGTVTWNPVDDPFRGGKVYIATITLTAKAGFTLTGVAANYFTITGATIVTNITGSGVVTAMFPETELKVGDSYNGGIVAYIFQSGDPGYVANEQHGLIASTADQSLEIEWSNITSTLVGTTGTAIGTGQANTTAIVGQEGCKLGAAKLCEDLTEHGYNDWFLPSRDELNKLYINKGAIGGFYYIGIYWSSSERDADGAWQQTFFSGYQVNYGKGYVGRVRAVRYF
jgi:hypothetical protein